MQIDSNEQAQPSLGVSIRDKIEPDSNVIVDKEATESTANVSSEKGRQIEDSEEHKQKSEWPRN
jgi:hypothetical protein